MVTDSNREPLGIVGISDLVPLLADIDRAGTELFRLGITSPGFIHSSLTISDALGMLNHSRKKCLIVLSDDKNVTGMITSDELAGAFLSTPELIIEEIKNACDTETLRCIFLKFRSLAVSMIAGHADPYETVLFNSFVADAICRRVLTVCIDELGDPPCRFAFIQTGSAGRREQTLSTDQDNAIIFENCEEAVMAGVSSYFLALGRKVNEMLSGVGYMLCKGGKMAGNPLWCQPLNRWKRYFSDWIRSPGPSEILEMSIFFDFRFCYGDSSLADELREYVSSGIRTSDIYFHHVASAWKQFATVTDLRMERKADIKRLIMPLTGIIRLYALRHGVKGFSTTERIIDLYSEDLLDHNMLRNAIKAWKDLTSLRLIRQAECLKGGVEPDNIIDFRLVNYDLVSYAEQAAETVNELMLKAGTDFFTDQI